MKKSWDEIVADVNQMIKPTEQQKVNGQYNVVQEWKSVLIEAFRLGTTST